MKKLKRNLYKRPKKRFRPKSKKSSKTKQSPKLLKEWSVKVRTRDSFVCQSCGSKKNTHAHHMVSKYYVPEYSLNIKNGITLCKTCHIGRQGVHGNKNPKNSFIKFLRLIYATRDIKQAFMFQKEIRTL